MLVLHIFELLPSVPVPGLKSRSGVASPTSIQPDQPDQRDLNPLRALGVLSLLSSDRLRHGLLHHGSIGHLHQEAAANHQVLSQTCQTPKTIVQTSVWAAVPVACCTLLYIVVLLFSRLEQGLDEDVGKDMKLHEKLPICP